MTKHCKTLESDTRFSGQCCKYVYVLSCGCTLSGRRHATVGSSSTKLGALAAEKGAGMHTATSVAANRSAMFASRPDADWSPFIGCGAVPQRFQVVTLRVEAFARSRKSEATLVLLPNGQNGQQPQHLQVKQSRSESQRSVTTQAIASFLKRAG